MQTDCFYYNKKASAYEKQMPKVSNYEWWGYLDLNQGPIGYEPTALTTELYPQNNEQWTMYNEQSGNCKLLFVNCTLKQWRWMRDSNPRGALRHPTGLANPPLQPLE